VLKATVDLQLVKQYGAFYKTLNPLNAYRRSLSVPVLATVTAFCRQFSLNSKGL